MRIWWTPAAAADLQGISDYLKEHHPRYRDPDHAQAVRIYPRVETMAGAWPTEARGRHPRKRTILRVIMMRTARFFEQSRSRLSLPGEATPAIISNHSPWLLLGHSPEREPPKACPPLSGNSPRG